MIDSSTTSRLSRQSLIEGRHAVVAILDVGRNVDLGQHGGEHDRHELDPGPGLQQAGRRLAAHPKWQSHRQVGQRNRGPPGRRSPQSFGRSTPLPSLRPRSPRSRTAMADGTASDANSSRAASSAARPKPPARDESSPPRAANARTRPDEHPDAESLPACTSSSPLACSPDARGPPCCPAQAG